MEDIPMGKSVIGFYRLFPDYDKYNNKNINTLISKNMNTIADVTKFHRLFNHPILETPQIPTDDRCGLRVSLLLEEIKELQQAIKDKNIVEIADALADTQYVLSGAILEFGLGDLFPAVFAEVQRSNMSKACTTLEETYKTIDYHFELDGTRAHFTEKIIKDAEGKDTIIYLVIRTKDNKILKSINYSPADLSFVNKI